MNSTRTRSVLIPPSPRHRRAVLGRGGLPAVERKAYRRARLASVPLLLLGLGVGCVALSDSPGPRRPPRTAYSRAELQEMERCLPEGLTLQTRFAPEGHGFVRETITVREKLEELHARCRDGKLYDASERELYFYRVPEYGCQPPPGLLQAQGEEYRRLQQRFHVIDVYAAMAPV